LSSDFTAQTVKGSSFAFFWRNTMNMRFALSGDNWRSPLRVIDSFLPQTLDQRLNDTPIAHRWMARFSQAGWLSTSHITRTSNTRSVNSTRSPGTDPHTSNAASSSLVVRSNPKGLRISGCVADVCAELDRLALLESRQPNSARH
jgi:hypothetical protein